MTPETRKALKELAWAICQLESARMHLSVGQEDKLKARSSIAKAEQRIAEAKELINKEKQ